MLPALLAPLALASDPALLRVRFDRPAILVVDERDVQYAEGGGDTVVGGLAPGGHRVSIRNLANHELWAGVVDTPAGSEVKCGWKRRTLVCTEAPPPAADPATVTLTVRALDAEWADVRIDGKLAIEVRNDGEGTVALTPGVHTVEILDFMHDAPYAVGRLETGTADQVILGVAEGQAPICYECSGWTPSTSPL